MATVIPIGEPVNEAERQAIAHLRDHLPSSYLVLHNFEIIRDSEAFEVDVAVIAPHAVYLVDVKGTRGLIDVYGPKWYPQGRQPFNSPLAKLRGHAKAVKGIITTSQPGRRDLEDIYVDAAVVLTASAPASASALVRRAHFRMAGGLKAGDGKCQVAVFPPRGRTARDFNSADFTSALGRLIVIVVSQFG